MRRIISILLSVLMIVSMCTFVGFGASAAELELPTEPELETLEDTTGWVALSSADDFSGRKAKIEATGKYYLTADITLNATIDMVFEGEFHGNGHTITVSAPLFNNISGATISNLKIVGNVSDAGAENIGLLAKIGGTVTVTNVITEGSVRHTSDKAVTASAAGFIGMLTSAGESTFTNCYNKADVVGKNSDPNGAAGIVGLVSSGNINLNGCVNTGTITGNNDAAGIVCYAKAFVNAEDCINAGVIQGKDAAGGIMAHTTSGYELNYCINSNVVTSSGNSAAGMVANSTGNASFDKTMIGCENTATITGGRYIGGMGGYINTAKLISFIDCINSGYILSTCANGGATESSAAGIVSNTVTYVVIENCENSGDCLSYWRQASGIIGYAKAGYEITGCTNSGNITAQVKASYVDGAYVGGSYTATMAAGILGYGNASSTYDGIIENCSNSGNIISDERAGGIAGNIGGMKNFVIADCINIGNVECTGVDTNGYAGGIVAVNSGGADKSEIVRCVNTGNVTIYQRHTGEKIAGGIVASYGGRSAGTSVRGVIEYCWSVGDVTAAGDFAAGIYAKATQFSGSNDRGVVVKNCGVSGTIAAANGIACGIGGYADAHTIEAHNNFFIGTLDGNKEVAFICSTQTTVNNEYGFSVDDFNDNYLLGTYNIAYTGYNVDAPLDHTVSDLAEGYAITADDVTSGKLAYMMQEATDEAEIIWGQSIGTDLVPVLFGEKVALYNGDYINAYIAERRISLDDSFKYTIAAKADADAKVEFIFNGKTVEAEGEIDGSRVIFEFDGIAPQLIDCEITTNLYYGDVLIDSKTESILDYCEAVYQNGAHVLDVLVEKVYLYGKAARDYVVAKGLYSADELPAIESDTFEEVESGLIEAPHAVEVVPGTASGAEFIEAKVRFDSANSIVLAIAVEEGIDASKVLVNGEAVVATAEAGVYEYVMADIYARDFSEDYTFVLTVDGEVAESISYGIVTYATRIAASESASAEMKALAVATYEYGVAAEEYYNATVK